MWEEIAMVLLNRQQKKKLTNAFVANVKRSGKYYDGHGLILLVDKNQSGFWVQRITVHGKRRDLGLGSAKLMPLAKAREVAFNNLVFIQNGGDPFEERDKIKNILTFAQAAEQWHAVNKPTYKTEHYAGQIIRSLEMHVFPHIGHIKIADITRKHATDVIERLWATKRDTAERLIQRMNGVFNWAISKSQRIDNPMDNITEGLSKVEKVVTPRKALPYEQIHDCLQNIKASNAEQSTKLGLELLILTATRSSEVRKATWSEFDLENRIWLIPVERMKMKRPHRIPLCDRAIEILKQAKANSNHSTLVFPNEQNGKPMSDVRFSKLVKELGYPVNVHGFRTTFRTWVQERTDYSRDVAEFALAHVVGSKVEQAYARSDLFEKRIPLMNDWAEFVATLSIANKKASFF